MTDTHEAVRLAEWLENDIPPHDRGQLLQAAALLRRIPELEAERDQLRAELENRFNWMPLPTQEGDK